VRRVRARTGHTAHAHAHALLQNAQMPSSKAQIARRQAAVAGPASPRGPHQCGWRCLLGWLTDALFCSLHASCCSPGLGSLAIFLARPAPSNHPCAASSRTLACCRHCVHPLEPGRCSGFCRHSLQAGGGWLQPAHCRLPVGRPGIGGPRARLPACPCHFAVLLIAL
jgi:hypothetical protein